MTVNKTTKISLSENKVKDILAQYLRDYGYKVTAKDIDFRIKSRYKGDYPFGLLVEYLDEAVVIIKEG